MKTKTKKDKVDMEPNMAKDIKPAYEADNWSLNMKQEPIEKLTTTKSLCSNNDWLADKACKIEDDLSDCLDQFQEVPFNQITIKLSESHGEETNSKMTCTLCGARYTSQLKYEFHMERHKFGRIDLFICPLCQRKSTSENLLWDHYFYIHKNTQRYICMTCGKLFPKQSKLKNHQDKYNHSGINEIHIETDENGITIDNTTIRKAIVKEIQGMQTGKCTLCGKEVTDLDPNAINDAITCTMCEGSDLSLMVDSDGTKVISRRQYHCSKCTKHFLRKERLEFHEMRHNEDMSKHICSSCGKKFSAENALYEHYIFVHKGARPHICELCGKSFQLKARLKEHLRSHTGERPYKCDACDQRCMTANALKIHKKIHSVHERFVCQICNKTFSKKQNMNEHLEKHWKYDRKIVLQQAFKCRICSEKFPTFRSLKRHMIETHEIDSQDPILMEQKPWYKCEQCNEKFKHQMSLKVHREKIHQGKVNPIFHCDVCDATFKIKQLLANHIKSKHDGEKRYKCAQCGKGFNETKSLHNHILLHTGKKPYTCEYCGIAFRRKDSRDQHHRKHTGEQPYKCQDCDETFSSTNNRSKHRKQVHEKRDCQICPDCGDECIGQQQIRIHLNMHLGEKLKKLEES
ncbi:zinc finger protein 85 [Cephus cinctus]|uniref:Zinc finger protein 85 n=1 Tax=Cephus cinctus TaxID=211228 RepID=A0AAJ7BPK9_CEPCN|nr:zinc finger protein 85 [Cephus cinctus]XP_024938785.1 zinc finger protein 85 [Cephus cinctus]